MSATIPTPSTPVDQGPAEARLLAQAERAGLADIATKVLAGTRLSPDDGLRLYASPDLFAVGALANHVRERLHGDATYFNVNQHVNYTNLCNRLCKFCAFQRLPSQEGAYVWTPEEAAERIKEQLDEPVTEVHVVGGVWPKLDYAYYLDLLRAIKAARPAIHIKGFTMVELDEIVKQAGKPELEVLAELREAGLDSCPGGGAEVFHEEVRQAAHRFMEEFGGLGLMHQLRVNDHVKVLESYVAPTAFQVGDVTIAKGTWLLAVRVLSDDLWRRVKDGELTGFSIGGSARRVPEPTATEEAAPSGAPAEEAA